MRVDLFSTRKRLAALDGVADVYRYDELPKPLRVQLAQIAKCAIGPDFKGNGSFIRPDESLPSWATWNTIHTTLCREYGRKSLAAHGSPMDQVLAFWEDAATVDEALDVLELVCYFITNWAATLSKYERPSHRIEQSPEDAINEINHRLQRAGVGYRVEGGIVVRIDSQFVHAEVVKPAVALLAHPSLAGANEEFLSAHRHYREGRYEEALVDACKSLESTLKAVLAHKGLSFDSMATAKPLIDEAMKGLLPAGLVAHVGVIRATLEQGVPYLRNNLGGHGQGGTVREVPEDFVAYALHLTAAAILLLARSAGLQ